MIVTDTLSGSLAVFRESVTMRSKVSVVENSGAVNTGEATWVLESVMEGPLV